MDYCYLNWGPFLMTTRVEDNDFTIIKNNINNTYGSHNKHLVGRLQTSKKLKDENIKNVIDPYIAAYIEGLATQWKPDHLPNNFKFRLQLDNCWINYQKPYEYNPTHNHDGHISFIIYVDIPEVIYKEINNTNSAPNGAVSFTYSGDNGFNEPKNDIKSLLTPVSDYWFLPKTQDMYIFPSYLRHDVLHFETPDVMRLSIAGNYRIIEGEN